MFQQVMITKSRAKIVVCCLIGLVVLINGHIFLTRGLDRNVRGEIYCNKEKNYKSFNDVWTYIYLLSYSILPSLIMTICNAALIYKVSHTEQKKRAKTALLESNFENWLSFVGESHFFSS